MLLTQFKIAWRNLTANKGYALINILGLAIGICVAMLIALWVYDELEHNKNFENYPRIAQIYQSQNNTNSKDTGKSIPRPLENELRTNYNTHFKYLVMSSWLNSVILNYNNKSISFLGYYMQPDAPEMFSLQMEAGSRGGLKDIHSILLSASTAKKLFGTADPIGQTVKFDLQNDLKVTGVYKDLPYNSYFYDTNFIVPWELMLSEREWVRKSEKIWDNNSFQLFIQIADNTSYQTVENAIRWVKKEATNNNYDLDAELHVVPMQDWKLRNNFENGKQVGGRIEYVILFGSIGIIVLLLACINFMNLATARSEKRAKEVGVKKTIGAARFHLIQQFYSESFVVVFLAFCIALLLLQLSINGFNSLSNKLIELPWLNVNAWTVAVVILIITALVSGSYPAIYLSQFKPVNVLKRTFINSKFSGLSRKILVIFQFVLSIVLVIVTVVINRQMEYVKNGTKGYDMNNLIELNGWQKPFYGKYKIVKEALLKSGAATAVSASSSPVTDIQSNRSFFDWEGKPEGFMDDFAWVSVTEDYANTLKMKLIKGTDFFKNKNSDSTKYILINETAQHYMGLKEPIGKIVKNTYNQEEEADPPMEIVGVVADIVMGDQNIPPKQTFFSLENEDVGYYQVRLNPENAIQKNISIIAEEWNKLAPNVPFDYNFVDADYAKKFEEDERMIGLVGIFTLLAIFISCLGLFGLTSFVAEQRTKEIGIRKSIGASVFQIWQIVSKDFLVLVLVASFIAIPLAHILIQHWLSNFKIRISVTHWYFLTGIGMAVLLSMLTVSYHAIKAANANPINSLKTE
ncbi:ABC transporter permease [Aquimarina agarivorans]|uniref:ABC transporter permease n=1 Tax=Aquimarina agarivorans TaxID=980584 RepID=UPI000248FD33|nr:ABC transporter permease [Aquimarina agarivorans]